MTTGGQMKIDSTGEIVQVEVDREIGGVALTISTSLSREGRWLRRDEALKLADLLKAAGEGS